jgi:Barrel-sandwich domain of CusB or HlyD membrane-fusion
MGNLSRMWFHAEVYERDLPDIRIGQKAVLRTPTVPGREFEGVVTFIDPNFDPRTRSTKVRVEVDNPLAEGDARGLAEVSQELAADDAVAAVKAGQRLRELAEALGETGDARVDQLLAQLRQIPKNPSGSDLKALRQSFLPWSTAGADLALALKRGGQALEVTVFECPMTGDSFPTLARKC